jgi:hypothetical protein
MLSLRQQSASLQTWWNPYTELCRRLLAEHQKTNIQWVEQLFSLPPLGGQNLSELLAEMLRLCPSGQENNSFFNCLFLNKLIWQQCSKAEKMAAHINITRTQ